jgi:hypothetical protein
MTEGYEGSLTARYLHALRVAEDEGLEGDSFN